MATSFDEINYLFYDMVEQDQDFFRYYQLTDDEAFGLAKQRADSCLVMAASQLALKSSAGIYFGDFNTGTREFASDLTETEKYLLARFQYQQYLFRDFATLRAQATRFTSAEQTVFSPANDRKTFVDMYERLAKENRDLLNSYSWRDRLTGQQHQLSYEDI